MGGALIAVGAVVIVGACVLLWSRPSNDTDIGAELLFVVGIGVFALDVARIDRTLFLVGRALTAIGAVLIVVGLVLAVSGRPHDADIGAGLVLLAGCSAAAAGVARLIRDADSRR